MITTTQIVERFKRAHGEKFDFSLVEYKGSLHPVIIICPIHGWINVDINSFIRSKHGCTKCGFAAISKATTIRNQSKPKLPKPSKPSKPSKFQLFVEKAVAKYGNRFDYSQVNYVGADIPVTIICPVHGEFKQSPSNHIASLTGCPECGAEYSRSRSVKDELVTIAEAIVKHGNKFNYSKVKYINADTPVTIICPVHGEFKQCFDKHIASPTGCRRCTAAEKIQYISSIPRRNKSFIERGIEIHNNRFDYSKVEYVNRITPVTIICPVGHEFKQTPVQHIKKKSGCPKCNLKTDNDVAYLWQADGCYYQGLPVYKFGITSDRLDMTRIETVAKKHGMKPVLIHKAVVHDALAVEALLKPIGTKIPELTGDGRTEFRSLTPTEFYSILDILQKAA